MSEALSNLIGFFQRGGLFMWPLLICSIVALTTIILRSFALREKHIMPLVIESEIERLMPGGSPDRLMRIVENDPSSLGRIVRIALQHLGSSSAASDTRQIALGIAEALNATVFGLSIAVPTLVAFSYFSKKVEVMSVEMETLVVELIAKCYFGRGAQEGSPPVRMTTRTQVLTPSPG